LNSHGEKGMKFWIGNSALTANKTVMWAQLIVDGINYGPHVFILQIRDEKNHKVLPGIIIGDCGPKNGLNGIDNGYTMLKDVRIPSKALLGKLG
jgi:acyl-CoA oxidase